MKRKNLSIYCLISAAVVVMAIATWCTMLHPKNKLDILFSNIEVLTESEIPIEVQINCPSVKNSTCVYDGWVLENCYYSPH